MIADKPSIMQVIGERLTLRRVGREFVGLCPFHDDNRPSLSISKEKGLFHCFGCGESGDAIDFIMKLDGVNFTEAKRALGISEDRKPRPTLTPSRKRAAELAALWVNKQRAKFNVLTADALFQRDLADEIGDFELAEIFDRELLMLCGFYEALGNPRGATELLSVRESIERITEGTPSTL